MQARNVVRYQITGPDKEGQCRMTIVEMTVGWHKGIRDNRAILDINAEAVVGLRHSHTPGEKLDSDVFTRASIEASSHLNRGLDLSLGKAEASVDYNAFRDEVTRKSDFTKPKFKAKGKKVTADLENVVDYTINGKIAGIKITRKNCN